MEHGGGLDQGGRTATEDARTKSKRLVSREDIEEQLQQLSRLTLDGGQMDDAREAECYIEVRSSAGDKNQRNLGPYAKWLVAAHCLMLRLKLSFLSELFNTTEENELRLGVADLFRMKKKGTRKDSHVGRFREYMMLLEDASRQQSSGFIRILERIIEELGKTQENRQRHRISGRELLQLEVPFDPSSKTVGRGPLKWLSGWLDWGVGAPFNDLVALSKAPAYLVRSDPRDALLERVIDRVCSHQASSIINIHAHNSWAGLRGFATDLCVALLRKQESSVAPCIDGTNIKTDDDVAIAVRMRVPTIPALLYISLERSATRSSVIRELYRMFRLPTDHLQSLSKRTVDLNADLEPIRRALTIYPTLLIFDRLENFAGRFEALHDVICNTHWIEFIRVLAQPHAETCELLGRTPRSQVLVLSNAAVEDIEAWRSIQEALPIVDDVGSLFAPKPEDLVELGLKKCLLEKLQSSSVERDPLPQLDAQPVCIEEWAEANFGVPSANVEWMFKPLLSGPLQSQTRVPDATELELIDVPTLDKLSEVRARVAELLAADTDGDRLKTALMQALVPDRTAPYEFDAVALKFIAASVNGMRYATLCRCMLEWERLLAKEDGERRASLESYLRGNAGGAKHQTAAGTLRQRYPSLLRIASDEAVESLNVVEIQRSPLRISDDASFFDAGQLQSENCVMDLRSRDIRAVFVRHWLGDERRNTDPEAGASQSQGFAPECTWGLVHFVLAEESLRQATSQLRHLHANVPTNVYSTRRLAQAIFHGLMSIEQRIDAPTREQRVSLFGQSFPRDLGKRYRYLYAFLYRRCIEANEWIISRSFARPDLRLELLTIFESPTLGRDMLSHEVNHYPPREQNSKGDDDVRYQPQSDAVRQVPCNQPLHQAMRSDLLLALAHAADDRGGEQGRALLKWVLREMPDFDGPINMLEAYMRDPGFYRRARKLHLDFQLANESKELEFATQACKELLSRYGVQLKQLEAIQGEARELFASAEPATRIGPRFEAFFAKVERINANRSQQDRIIASNTSAAADFLFRLGAMQDALGKQIAADSPATERKGNVAYAWALHWLADRMRSDSGTNASEGIRWGMASAQACRHYVRITLELAFLLNEESVELGHDHPALWLVQHAQSRTDLFTRHLFRLPRERVTGLLLQVSVFRHWSRLLDKQGKETRKIPSAGGVDRFLHAADNVLKEAEGLLLFLGYHPNHVRRLLCERIELMLMLAPRKNELATHYEVTIGRDLEVLERTADSEWWKRTVAELGQRVRQMYPALGRPLA